MRNFPDSDWDSNDDDDDDVSPGILSQAIPSSLDSMLPPGHNYTTYLAASYVKWVEGAGARAVPIIVSDNKDNLDYYDQVDRGRSLAQ